MSLRHAWRTLRLWASNLRWFRVLRAWHTDPTNPALLEMLRHRPSITCVTERPYVNSAWTPRERLAAIESHYRAVRGPCAFLGFAPESQFDLAVLAADTARVRFALEKPEWFVHEGEVTLSLFSGATRIYSLVFLLAARGETLVARIGALQGLGDPRALDIYRDLTRAMHGQRPRQLLTTAFQMLCVCLGIERILAVEDRYSMGRNGYFMRTRVHTSYDTAWDELGGTPAGDGFTELPATPSRRAPHEIPARKRALYRLRYSMLDDLEAQIFRAVHGR